MTEQDFNKLRGIVKAYSAQRDKVHDQVAQIRQDVKDRKINAWTADMRIHQLYTDLTNCSERQDFIQEEKKIHNDPVFEKYFRSAAMEYFLKNKIRPEDL
jgi:hypothetical protein